jgi:hypothetical protein
MAQLDDVIEIRDPDIDVEEIMTQIRKRIQQRRAEAQGQGLDYDRLVDDNSYAPHAVDQSDSELAYEIYQVRSTADTIWVSLSIAGRRVPLIDGLVARVRRELHNLVIYYVNMLAGRQVAFNRSAANVLLRLVETRNESRDQIAALEEEVAGLRQRLEAMEQALNSRE